MEAGESEEDGEVFISVFSAGAGLAVSVASVEVGAFISASAGEVVEVAAGEVEVTASGLSVEAAGFISVAPVAAGVVTSLAAVGLGVLGADSTASAGELDVGEV